MYMGTLRQDGQKLFWHDYNETLLIEPWGHDSLRVRATTNAHIRDNLFSALLTPPASSARITIDEHGATVVNGQLTATLSSSGFLRFLRTDNGQELLSEEPQLRATRRGARNFKAVQNDLFHLEARFRAYDDEHIYGLGQHQHGLLDQKGCTLDLIQRNTEVSIPFMVSSRGYGFLWHNPAIGRVELSRNMTRWEAEATPQLDYWVTTGPTYADILEHYADATGHPSEFPTWGSGFWQCKLRYRTQEELLSIARQYKERGLPLSVIVIDFFNWTLQGDWRFNPEEWPDPAAMVRELDTLGVKAMVSVWPTINPLSENYHSMEERGLLLRTERGIASFLPFQDTRPDGPVDLRLYDPTNPEARQFLWEKVRANYFDQGIHSYWLDGCEPEMDPLDPDNLRFYLGNGQAIANIYPLVHTQGLYENMHAAGEQAVLNLTRSGWVGSQRFGVVIWSGDITSTYEALQAQVRAGLNMAMSGIPWWTTDTGGFYGADVHSDYFRELIVRWFQYSTFCPVMRLHGYRDLTGDPARMRDSGDPNEVWSFGEEAYAIIREYLFLRERLRPYIEEQMQLAHQKGTPAMRPLFFDFADDPTSFAIDDQYLFGPALLVAPILTASTTQREVYLPSGATWTDAWTGARLDGGQRILATAPISRIPLYLRDDYQLPIQK
jgi:alpha-D-xyloside xylohydrolase